SRGGRRRERVPPRRPADGRRSPPGWLLRADVPAPSAGLGSLERFRGAVGGHAWGAVGALERVGASGRFVLGREVAAFETALSGAWPVPGAAGCGNGLDAIEIGLRCPGLAPGTPVLTTPLSSVAATLAILARAECRGSWSSMPAGSSTSMMSRRGTPCSE